MTHERSLLLDAVVYLAAAVVFVPLASRFKLGSVLGYLAAGCVIGPFGLGLISDVQTILHFAEFGVVMMLFLIGLEVDPARLFAMRRAVFFGGGVQMLACGVALGAGAVAAGLPWKAAIVAGLALALSSTAIAVQTMKERGLMGAPMGRAAFATLLFQDIAAIPLVGVVPLLAESSGGGGGSSLLGVGKVVLAIVGVVVVGRFAVQPILRAIAATHLREVFTAFALLLVLGIAQLMELAGVSMALGAFLAGVLLASSEYRHALETDVEPFKGLLMGLFFIAVGMSIDFDLLTGRPFFLLALVGGFVAVKTLVMAAIAPLLGAPASSRGMFAALLSQGSEFAFVVFGVATTSRVFPGSWDKILTLVVALSMAATPVLVIVAGKLEERAGRKSARDADPIDAEDAPIVIAGFGRFGQIVGRLLFASGLKATVLDFDSEQIDVMRRFGFRVFYGDATRLDLLHAAGAEKARVIVNAIDDQASSLKLVEIVKHHFPHATIVSRARDVTHLYELRRRGVTVVERETFESALRVGRHVFEALGVRPFEARERADQFRRHNLRLLSGLGASAIDDAERTARVRAARDELEEQFRQDVQEIERLEEGDWSREGKRERDE